MDWNYKELLPADFSPESRVWIYQSNRLFTISEALRIEELLQDFVSDWHSHSVPVKGYGNLFFGQFIILMADESATGVSGCSTDSSVRLIKQIEQEFKVDMFNRQLLAFIIEEKLQIIPLSQFGYAAENNFIHPEILYFNNTIQTREELENKWIIPIKESWLNARLQQGKKALS